MYYTYCIYYKSLAAEKIKCSQASIRAIIESFASEASTTVSIETVDGGDIVSASFKDKAGNEFLLVIDEDIM